MLVSFKHPLAVGRNTGKLYTPTTYQDEEAITCFCGCDRTLLIRRQRNPVTKRHMSTHFAYKTVQINSRDCSFKSSESFNHLYAKRLLYEKFTCVWFEGPACVCCHTRKHISFNSNSSVAMEKKVGQYRPDVTVHAKTDSCVWALEVYETHAKGEQQVQDMTRAGLCVAEFRALEIIKALETVKDKCKKLTNLIPWTAYNEHWECTACEYKTWWAAEWEPDVEMEQLKVKGYEQLETKERLKLFQMKVDEFEKNDKMWRRQAMAAALDTMERLAMPVKKARYNPDAGLIKCGSCQRWVFQTNCKKIEMRDWGSMDINWWHDNTSHVCHECFTGCYACGRLCLIQQIAKYARCKDCNNWIASLRRATEQHSIHNLHRHTVLSGSPWIGFLEYLYSFRL